MANVFTAVQPVLYSDGVSVPRELIGGLNAMTRNWNDEGVAKGDSVKVTVVPTLTASNHTPAQNFTAGSDRTLTARTFTLSNEKVVSWNMTAEEERSLMNSQVAQDTFAQTIQQGYRTIANLIEAEAVETARLASTRAFGTAGTTPFASNLSQLANMKKILDDNGANGDRGTIINTDAEVNLLSLTQFTDANRNGSDSALRAGSMGTLFGFNMYRSAQISDISAVGTGASYQLSAALAVGDTTVNVDTGSGTILAGDVVTISNHKYVAATELSGGSFTIQSPGIREVVADNTAITVNAIHTANLSLIRSAMVSVARPGLQPQGGGIEQQTIVDPVSGIPALLVRDVGDGQASWYMRTVYDSFAPNPYGIATLLG